MTGWGVWAQGTGSKGPHPGPGSERRAEAPEHPGRPPPTGLLSLLPEAQGLAAASGVHGWPCGGAQCWAWGVPSEGLTVSRRQGWASLGISTGRVVESEWVVSGLVTGASLRRPFGTCQCHTVPQRSPVTCVSGGLSLSPSHRGDDTRPRYAES